MEYCFYQVFKNGKRPRLDGWGDCSACTPSPENKKCKGYLPIKIQIFKIKEVEIWKKADAGNAQ